MNINRYTQWTYFGWDWLEIDGNLCLSTLHTFLNNKNIFLYCLKINFKKGGKCSELKMA